MLSQEIIQNIKKSILPISLACFGFFVGKLDFSPDEKLKTLKCETKKHKGISLIQLKNLDGDTLQTNISGPVRILWSGNNIAEGEGNHRIPLSQIPTKNDLELSKFKYTGNQKTKKFYPSSSHFARCTAVESRRFFAKKDEAIAAGFIPSKAVK